MSDTTAPTGGHGIPRRLGNRDLRHSFVSVTNASETDNYASHAIPSKPISPTPSAARSLFSSSNLSSDAPVRSASPPRQPVHRVPRSRTDQIVSRRDILEKASESYNPTWQNSTSIDSFHFLNMENRLCQTCWEMTMDHAGLSRLLSMNGYTHHSRQKMELSASMGCLICAAVMQYVARGLSQEITRNTWVGNV